MNNTSKNKILTWLVLLLLIANIASIAIFWLGKKNPPAPPKGTPKDFLIKELKLDEKQQAQLEVLVKEHREAAERLRGKIRESKEALFDLVKQPAVTDSTKQAAAKNVSANTEALDILTLEHFQKVRALCNAEQQKKFDEIIQQVTNMMGQPRPPNGPGRQGGPPEGPNGERPPPPGEERPPPPGN